MEFTFLKPDVLLHWLYFSDSEALSTVSTHASNLSVGCVILVFSLESQVHTYVQRNTIQDDGCSVPPLFDGEPAYAKLIKYL